MGKFEGLLAEDAYSILLEKQPKLIKAINALIDSAHTKKQIMAIVSRKSGSVFLNALIEMAVNHCFELRLKELS